MYNFCIYNNIYSLFTIQNIILFDLCPVGQVWFNINDSTTVACQNGLCAVMSSIGVCADGLLLAASFRRGPIVTTIVRVLVSITCNYLYCVIKKQEKCRRIINVKLKL